MKTGLLPGRGISINEDDRRSMEDEMCEGTDGLQPVVPVANDELTSEYSEDFGKLLDDEMPLAILSGAEAAAASRGLSLAVSGTDIDVTAFGELVLQPEQIEATQKAWNMIVVSAASREAVADAIYGVMFDTMQGLQHLFVTPRAVQSMRFFQLYNTMIASLSSPADLKSHVETLGFQHMQWEVTLPRCIALKEAIVDFFAVELGSKFGAVACSGLAALLNYVAGSLIYIKTTYADRLKRIRESWKIANNKEANAQKFVSMNSWDASGKMQEEQMVQNVPTTYGEMFQFNAAVMGFGGSMWMNEVLAQFDNIVNNVSNAGRMQEECCVLVLRIAKVTSGKVNLDEYKSCMLASLRSLLPKDWTTPHEAAWTWLWESVEKCLLVNMGKTQAWEEALRTLIDGIDEAALYELRQDFYSGFFAACPAGESFFKQSNTYLHLIATKVIMMTVEMYADPIRLVDEISGAGLRHVGYGIPTELFGPFVSVWVESMLKVDTNETAIEAFRWSLGLVAKMQARTIREGSTIVMQAININSAKAVDKAIACAPRGERAKWMLLIQVGTQDISPLLWAIRSGAIDAAVAMLSDLMTIRADRDQYYFAAEDVFERHSEIVQVLLHDAPGMLPRLLDGLVWRSRVTENGYRRVNYYVKYLLVDRDGSFHKTLEWIVQSKDPKIVCHPVLVFVADLLWNRVACRSFILGKAWFLVSLGVFITSQSALKSVAPGEIITADTLRLFTFLVRCIMYMFSMGFMIFSHSAKIVRGYRKKDTMTVLQFFKFPKYLANWQDCASLALCVCLVMMMASEPILICLNKSSRFATHDDEDVLFSARCEPADAIRKFPYSFFSMTAMMLYYVLLLDLAVFNNRVSAYLLVCGRMLSELALYLITLFMVLVTLSSALSCWEQDEPDFGSIGIGMMTLWEMVLAIYSTDDYARLHNDPIVLLGCYAYLVVAVLFLSNILIAQLSCAYDAIYKDMVGYARLKRIRVITETMPAVTEERWTGFTKSLMLEARIEFNEGDVGVAGGIQTQELASENPTAVDVIKRFGGSTAPTMPWPEEEKQGEEEADKFQRLEEIMKKIGEQVQVTNATLGHKQASKERTAVYGNEGVLAQSRVASRGQNGSPTGSLVDGTTVANRNDFDTDSEDFDEERAPR